MNWGISFGHLEMILALGLPGGEGHDLVFWAVDQIGVFRSTCVTKDSWYSAWCELLFSSLSFSCSFETIMLLMDGFPDFWGSGLEGPFVSLK